jgi:type IV secretory pathway VirB2 component (pilin)
VLSNKTRLLTLFLLVALVLPGIAHAAGAGGGAMPWDTPLTTLRDDLTGPLAFTLSLLAFVVAGVALIFGGEMGHFVRGVVMAVMVASMLTGIVNFAAALGIAGATVL